MQSARIVGGELIFKDLKCLSRLAGADRITHAHCSSGFLDHILDRYANSSRN